MRQRLPNEKVMSKVFVGWQRDGWWHYVSKHYFVYVSSTYALTRKLGFISYHLIRLIHGQRKLDEMAREGFE